MASFQELMRAAQNAEAAGDSAAAQQLVRMAQSIGGGPKPGQEGLPAELRDENKLMLPVAYDPATTVSNPQPDRFGDTIKAAMEGPTAARRAFVGGLTGASPSPSMQNMPEWMPGALKGPVATVGDAGGAVLSGAGEVYAFGAGLLGETFGGSPTNERKLARDLMMMGEVAAPELAGVNSGARVAGNAARRVTKAANPTEAQLAARAAEDFGITPSLGASGKGMAQSAATLEKVPFAGGTIADDAQRFVGEIEREFDRIVSTVGDARGPVGGGEALKAGADKFVVEFRKKSNEFYDAVAQKIPPGTKIETPETISLIRGVVEQYSDKPAIMRELKLNKLKAIADDLEGGLSWEAASDLRSSIGESIGRINGPLANMDQGKLKQAYARLTADLEAAAIKAGPGAQKAWNHANNYYRRGAKRIEETLDKTIRADSPERAFEAFAAMTKDGKAQSNSKRLYQIKASMPREEWNTVAASIVDRLGRATPGQQNAVGDVFSPAKFLTEWNGLSAEAKSILLPKGAQVELTKLARVAELSKKANAERNFSNTGTVGSFLAVMLGSSVDAGATAAALGALNISARAMTSERFLRAMNRAAQGDLNSMKAIAKSSDQFAKDATTILRLAAADAAGTSAANTNGQIRAVAP